MNIFKLPDLGEGLPDAEIVEWHVKEGDTVNVDQPLVSMETAKAVVEVPSPYAGKIIKLHGKAGDIIATDSPLVSFETADASDNEKADGATVAGKIEVGTTVLTESATGITPTHKESSHIKALPAVRALAKLLDVDLNSVTGTGKNGEITLEDIRHCEAASAAVAIQDNKISAPSGRLDCFANARNDGESTIEPLRGTRRAMSQAMSLSHAEVVPVTVFDDANIHAWSADTDITYRVIRAITAACQAEPALNAHFNKKSLERKLFTEVNIGIAMDSPEGLFVPVLKNAETLSAPEIRGKINHFKQVVRDRSIPSSDLQGSTIHLSNFGMFAGRYATPIVVPPIVAIIGTGKIREQAINANGNIALHKFMPLSLTVDHRAVTGAEATRFLKMMIEDLQKEH